MTMPKLHRYQREKKKENSTVKHIFLILKHSKQQKSLIKSFFFQFWISQKKNWNFFYICYPIWNAAWFWTVERVIIQSIKIDVKEVVGNSICEHKFIMHGEENKEEETKTEKGFFLFRFKYEKVKRVMGII